MKKRSRKVKAKRTTRRAHKRNPTRTAASKRASAAAKARAALATPAAAPAKRKRGRPRKSSVARRAAAAHKSTPKRRRTRRSTHKTTVVHVAAAPKARKRRSAGKRRSVSAKPRGRVYVSTRGHSRIRLTHLRNPVAGASGLQMGLGVAGVLLGLAGASMLDRYLATRAPEGQKEPLNGASAAAAIRKNADYMRLVGTGGLTAVAGVAAYFARKNKNLSYPIAGIAVGAGAKFGIQVVEDLLMPLLFKVDQAKLGDPEEAKRLANRLFPDKQAVKDADGNTTGMLYGFNRPRGYFGNPGRVGAPNVEAGEAELPFVGAPVAPTADNSQATGAVGCSCRANKKTGCGRANCSCSTMPPSITGGCSTCGGTPASVPPPRGSGPNGGGAGGGVPGGGGGRFPIDGGTETRIPGGGGSGNGTGPRTPGGGLPGNSRPGDGSGQPGYPIWRMPLNRTPQGYGPNFSYYPPSSGGVVNPYGSSPDLQYSRPPRQGGALIPYGPSGSSIPPGRSPQGGADRNLYPNDPNYDPNAPTFYTWDYIKGPNSGPNSEQGVTSSSAVAEALVAMSRRRRK